MKKVKDTDFLHISARIKMLEKNLLTKEDMDRMLHAPSAEEAAKIAVDKGYTPFEPRSQSSMDGSLDKSFKELMALLESYMPNKALLDFFKIRNDYSNIKAIIKGDAVMADIKDILSECGVYTRHEIMDMVRDNDFSNAEKVMADAIVSSREILSRTKDPQLSDIALDKAMYEHMGLLARRSGSDFLMGYYKNTVDGDNLRAAVRVIKMKKPAEFMENVIADGGNVKKSEFLTEEPDIEKIYGNTPFKSAAKTAEAVIKGEALFARLDIEVDNVLMEYARKAKAVSFGDMTVLGYVMAREREINQIRTVITGKNAKRSPEKIAESLRLGYV